MANDNAANDTQRVWDLMKKIGFAMLVTRDGDRVARAADERLSRSRREHDFLPHRRAAPQGRGNRRGSACQSVVRGCGNQKYVSLTGTAAISNDREKIRQLFSTPAKAWWDSAEDPNIRVLKISPDDAEFWDSPGSIISYVKMAAAAVTGTRPDLGDNRKVSM